MSSGLPDPSKSVEGRMVNRLHRVPSFWRYPIFRLITLILQCISVYSGDKAVYLFALISFLVSFLGVILEILGYSASMS